MHTHTDTFKQPEKKTACLHIHKHSNTHTRVLPSADTKPQVFTWKKVFGIIKTLGSYYLILSLLLCLNAA